MHRITDVDRAAAEELRVLLADISGFWHRAGDDSPLCIALARHRADAERRLMEKSSVSIAAAPGAVRAERSKSRRCEAMLRRVDGPQMQPLAK